MCTPNGKTAEPEYYRHAAKAKERMGGKSLSGCRLELVRSLGRAFPSDGITCSVAFLTTFVSHLTKLNINRKVSKIHFGSLLPLVLLKLPSKKRVSRGESFRGEKIM